MKIAVMGCGGVGGYFGARLATGGANVHFVARGAHLKAMREHGLFIEGATEPIHLANLNATETPAEIGVCDLVIIAVKLWDTKDALKLVKPLVGPSTTIISFQNGVSKDDDIRAAYVSTHIMGGAAHIAATIERPGVIRKSGAMQRLVFGEFDGRRSEKAETFLAACKNGGIDAELSLDVRRAIWEKFVFLVAFSGATASMRSTIGPIRENPQARAFLLDLMREVLAVGQAKGVNLDPDFPKQRLAFVDTSPADVTSSMHRDLERGNRLELPWLAGAAVAIGNQVGVPTPLNRAVADILALHASGRRTAPEVIE